MLAFFLSQNHRARFFKTFCPIVFAAVFLSPLAKADDDADARQILKNVAATYQKLQSYEIRATIENIHADKVAKSQVLYLGSRPQKFRIEKQVPDQLVTISDGKTIWTTNPSSNEYQKSQPGVVIRTPISDLEEIDQHVQKATIAREDLYEVNGKVVPVYVVMLARDRWPEGTPSGTYMASYRIDEESFKVYGANYYTNKDSQLIYYYISKWNEPVPDEKFVFTPSIGSHGTDFIMLPSHSASQIGSEAPDFTLSDPSGHKVHLQDLRGKVVIVDFWATWCGPCREQMPTLQQIHKQLSDKDVVVLGLNVGEDGPSVTEFAQRSDYTFTLLLGAEPSVTEPYFVDGFPTTLVVDRHGKIVYRSTGLEPPNKLIGAVQKAVQNKS